MKITRCPKTSFIVLILVVFSLINSLAFAENSPAKVTLGTATKGGGFQLYGANLIDVINQVEPHIKLEEVPTKGSKQNLPFLEDAKIDIGLVEGNAARQALDGVGREKANLKVLSVMYPNAGMFVVRADSDYHSIDDLKGKPIAFGTQASGLRILVNDVLDGLGLNPEKDFEQVILSKAADGPKLVLNKQVESLWGAGIGWPGFVKISNSPAGSRFIAPTDSEITRILAKHPHLTRMTVPAETYKGQTEAIESVGLWSLILVNPDVSDDVVYLLARAIHKGHHALSERLQQGSFTRAENTVKHVPVERLHPGALRFYREVGLIK